MQARLREGLAGEKQMLVEGATAFQEASLPQLHTASEVVARSNLAHWIEGCVLAVIALFALAEVFVSPARSWVRFLWPSLVVGSGIFLPACLLLHHGLRNIGFSWRLITSDHRQWLHLAMALLLLAAGTAELLYRSRRVGSAAWQLAWPAVLVTIGALFIVHQQHGTGEAVARAAMVHRFLGGALVAAGLARGVELRVASALRWARVVWPALLLLAAGLLVTYREPAAAFRIDPATQGQPGPARGNGGR